MVGPQRSVDTIAVIEGWNVMGGGVDWAAIDFVAELVGVRDPEVWIRGLMIVKQHLDEKSRREHQSRS